MFYTLFWIRFCLIRNFCTGVLVSLGKSVTPPPKLNVKELAQLYKQRSLESKVRKGKMKSMNVKTMLVSKMTATVVIVLSLYFSPSFHF